jgi:threonine dehydratase
MDIPATIVMPKNAPKLKRSATESYGARVVEYDPKEYEAAEVAKELKEKHGYTFIPPFDHPDIIAGQGTAAYELYRDYGPLDMLLVPCGGGGLLSGSAIAAKGVAPLTRVVGVEPEVADDATRSFYSGALQTVKNPPTIADGTRTPSLGKYTFPLVLQYVDEMITVSEKAIRQAVAFFFYRMKIVVEPSGALGLAALLSGAIFPPEKTGVIISGGNMDGRTLADVLSETDQ